MDVVLDDYFEWLYELAIMKKMVGDLENYS